MALKLKRAYEPAEPGDGFRVLVDRLWPRGISKSSARIDLWLKEIAPSTTLRKWFGHDPAKWTMFRDRYFRELDKNRDAVEILQGHMHHGVVTLVYGAKDNEHNDAVALKEYLEAGVTRLPSSGARSGNVQMHRRRASPRRPR
ncbi:MAG TPA: DUF488 domain-containing protein [Gemmatimonadota bacterium]|nr:DUF488 domain-containing protein [Gemmatimonadota bacterium]